MIYIIFVTIFDDFLKFFDDFQDVVIANEGELNMPERLSLLGEKYFPYREDLTE